MTTHRRALWTAVALLAWAHPAWTCGFEDPNSATAARGVLNVVYPDALHVVSAVWRAELDGAIERDNTPASARALVGFGRTTRMLESFGASMNAASGPQAPAFAVVLLTPMLWTRFESRGGHSVTPHVSGPDPGDVVVVTDESVVAALERGRLAPRRAMELGLVRFYGPEDRARMIAQGFASLIASNADP